MNYLLYKTLFVYLYELASLRILMISATLLLASVVAVMLVSYDRLAAAALTSEARVTKSAAVKLIILSWIVSIALSSPWIIKRYHMVNTRSTILYLKFLRYFFFIIVPLRGKDLLYLLYPEEFLIIFFK